MEVCPPLTDLPLPATRAVLDTQLPNRTLQTQRGPTLTYCPQEEAKCHTALTRPHWAPAPAHCSLSPTASPALPTPTGVCGPPTTAPCMPSMPGHHTDRTQARPHLPAQRDR